MYTINAYKYYVSTHEKCIVLQATELINNELPGDVSYEIVTVVVQDVDDEKPEFNEHSFMTAVSEDISKMIR